MNLLLLAAAIAVLIGVAHSYLGERYILIRLFRRELPKLFGDDWFTRQTLRFAWHVTTITLWGFAAVMIVLARADGAVAVSSALIAISLTFGAIGLIALIASKGRHLSWIAFFAIAILCWMAA